MISEQFLEILSLLGKKHPSDTILQFIGNQGVFFQETPSGVQNEYYYEFFDSGVTMMFKDDVIIQVSIYLNNDVANYNACQKAVFNDIPNSEITYDWAFKKFGTPLNHGGGDVSPLLGYTEKWLKYDINDCYINLQFSKENILSKIHFIYNPNDC